LVGIATADDACGLRRGLRRFSVAVATTRADLRWNAQLLLRRGDTPSIQQIADRLDGKPAQDTTVNINNSSDHRTEAELRDFIAAAIGASIAPASKPKIALSRFAPPQVHMRARLRHDCAGLYIGKFHGNRLRGASFVRA
jgi:hypothetical protein